jgi:hypothetical protein
LKLFSHATFYIFLTAVVFCLSSCSKQVVPLPLDKNASTITIQSLSVLPVEIAGTDKEMSHTVSQQLKEGAVVLKSSVKDLFQDKDGVSYLFPGQTESLLGDFHGNKHESALHIGKKIEADAVLTLRLIRYINREGKTYSTSQPASVSFEYSLIHVATGKVLCTGVFDESQESLFSNLFSFKQASKRGFKWITARQLTMEGLKEKFKDCHFLRQ